MLREEINRAFLSRSFLFAVFLGLLSLAYGYADYMSGPSDPEYLARLPPFYNNAYDAVIWAQKGLIGLIVPLIAVLPFADSFAHDRLLGYLRFVLSRTNYRCYLSAKYAISFLSGGLAVSLPMLLYFAFTNLVLPRGLNPDPFEQRVLSMPEALGPFGALYKSAPDQYIFSLIALSFLFGATYAIFGLSLSALTDNRYIVLATPFVLYNVVHYGLAILGIPAWSPVSAFVPHWLNHIAWLNVLTNLGGLFLISTALYFVMAHKVKSRI